MKKFFNLNSAKGCKRLALTLIALIVLFSLCAQLLTTDGGRIKVEKITIDARGAALEGELYYPVGTTDEDSYPGVVIVPGAGNIYQMLRCYAEELAHRGYVVFSINAYGSGASETPVYNENDQGILEYNIFGTPMGCLDAVNFMRGLEFVDKENIAVMGHSQGSRRSGYAALMDCGYFTLNDRLLNVLHEGFGVEISADDIERNADEIAEETLSADALKAYEILKTQETEYYNTRIRAAVLIGSTAQYVNPKQQVEVAGIEVTRNCQVNLCIINGMYDYGYVGFNSSDDVRDAWYIPSSDEVVQGAYYCLDDNAGANTIVGTFREDSVSSDPALANAIENRTLRTVLLTKETHSKETFSSQTSGLVIDYMNQALHGNVSIADADKGGMVFAWREFLNFAALLAMFALLIPVVKLLTMTPKYSTICVSGETLLPEKNRKIGAIFAGVGTVLLNTLAIYLTNARKTPFTFKTSSFFPLMITAWSPIQFLSWLTIFGLVIAVGYVLITGGYKSILNFAKKNIAVGFVNVLKTLLAAVIYVAVAYGTLELVQYLTEQDYRIWQVSFATLTADQWQLVFHYALLALPFMFISSITTNYLSDVTLAGKKPAVDVLITVAMAVAGVWLLCGISIIVDYAALSPGKSISSFMLTYGAILFLPIMTFVNRKAYQLTKNVWLGTFVSSLILGWTLVCMHGTNGSYVPQTWITNFFG